MFSLKQMAFIIFGGLFYFLAMPPIGWWWAAPLGLVCLALSDLKKYWQWAIVGTLLNLVLYFWLTKVSLLGWLGISIAVGLLWALPLWIFEKTGNRILAAASWVSIEGLRMYLGFGWLPLAVSTVGCPFLLRIGSIGGEALIGFLIVFFALSVVKLIRERDAKTKIIFARELFLFVPMVLILGLAGNSAINFKTALRLKVGIVQPDVPMNSETDKDYYNELELLRRTTNLLRADIPDIYFWPEQATPWPVNDDKNMRAWIEGGSKFLGRPVVSGVLWRENSIYYNAATVIDPQTGVDENPYIKQRLVPFGEYIPFSDTALKGLMHSMTPVVDSFGVGKKSVLLNVKLSDIPSRPAVALWPLICYEDAFDYLSWGSAQKSDAIVVFLNDSWFGWGARQQHAAHSVLRSVEQGLPIVRVSNDGLSGIILPDGSVDYLKQSNRKDSSIGGVFELPLVRVNTLYAHTQGLWRWGFVGLFFICMAANFISRKARKS